MYIAISVKNLSRMLRTSIRDFPRRLRLLVQSRHAVLARGVMVKIAEPGGLEPHTLRAPSAAKTATVRPSASHLHTSSVGAARKSEKGIFPGRGFGGTVCTFSLYFNRISKLPVCTLPKVFFQSGYKDSLVEVCKLSFAGEYLVSVEVHCIFVVFYLEFWS